MINNIKIFINEHQRLIKWIVIGLAIFIFLSILIVNFREFSSEVEEENNKPEEVAMTNTQKSLINGYDNQTKDLQKLFKNSKWTDAYQKLGLFITDKEIIERDNNEEYKSTYAICAWDKNTDKKDGKFESVYNITIIDGSDKYKTIIFTKVSSSENESAPIFTATIESGDIFKNSRIYIRCSNSDDFCISNWNNNVNQFIDGKYNELENSIKEYCARNLPSVGSVSWNEAVTINYASNLINLVFHTDTSKYSVINVMYLKDSGEFIVERK